MRELKIRKENIIENRTENLSRYFSDLNKIKIVLTPDEEAELCELIQTKNDPKAKEILINANLRFVVSVAKQYQNTHRVELEDLITEGNIGLIKAASKFDQGRGFKFISYAVWWIRQSILAYIGTNSRYVRLPSNRFLSLKAINQKISDLEQEHGASDVLIYLKDHFTEEEILYYNIALNTSNIVSLNVKFEDSNEERGNMIDSNTKSPIDILIESENNSLLYKAIDKLSGIEKEVVIYYFGLLDRDTLTIKEISKKFEISVSIISTMLNKIKRKLKIALRNFNDIPVKIQLTSREIARENQKKTSTRMIKILNTNNRQYIINKYTLKE